MAIPYCSRIVSNLRTPINTVYKVLISCAYYWCSRTKLHISTYASTIYNSHNTEVQCEECDGWVHTACTELEYSNFSIRFNNILLSRYSGYCVYSLYINYAKLQTFVIQDIASLMQIVNYNGSADMMLLSGPNIQ